MKMFSSAPVGDLFSSLDFQNFNIFGLVFPSWLVPVGLVLLLVIVFWEVPSGGFSVFGLLSFFFVKHVAMTKGGKISGFTMVLCSLFFLLLMLNLGGVSPYVFGITSHPIFNFSVGITLWLSLVLSGACYNYFLFVVHLLPVGAPSGLNPFLVVAESISVVIRPVTLSVRLAANMGAGHIVFGLVGGSMGGLVVSLDSLLGGLAVVLVFGLVVGYTLFEAAVCLVQSFIFTLLISLYSDDHPVGIERV